MAHPFRLARGPGERVGGGVMGGLITHLVLFLVVSLAIVLMGTFHAEATDAAALRAFPRRALTFLVGCGALAALVVLL